VIGVNRWLPLRGWCRLSLGGHAIPRQRRLPQHRERDLRGGGRVRGSIAAIPSLRILGKPDAYLVAFESSDAEVDILAVDAGMHERGWSGTQCVHP